MGNHKRFINHSESQPNVQALEIDIDDLRHVILIASQEIKKGQQILFNYGESYWAEEEQPRDLK
jgi:SET domain-containing protein